MAKGEWKRCSMCGFCVYVCVLMTSVEGQRLGEGALVSVNVESVTQTSSECTPRSQQSTQPPGEAGGLADGGLPEAVSALAA